ncbi:MAG: phosphoribosylaminoimidazolesuccinocarboxamide synthase [Rickettsiales bacterium]|jgi:phosphoribosylaminoimidazole-succinocarboxamide synthase|nr:phosphoribosylaminoimidazolesuccinocarboxamide synthase [Rickettsiales bacterium]
MNKVNKAETSIRLPKSLGEPHSGKVRDSYNIEKGKLLVVTSDRISALDIILNPGIPGKGVVLSQLSNFWMGKLAKLGIPNHLIDTDIDSIARAYPDLAPHKEALRNRVALVRKLEMLPIEAIVRGHLTGSVLKKDANGKSDYDAEAGTLFDHAIGRNIKPESRLETPIYTPSTKAESGFHDKNISRTRAAEIIRSSGFSAETARKAEQLAVAIFSAAREHAAEKSIILADTKLEFGIDEEENRKGNEAVILGDEALTPDSSRFWDADDYIEAFAAGREPKSFDKQPVRDFLTKEEKEGRWNGKSQPTLPDIVVDATVDRYIDAFFKLAGEDFNPSATEQLLDIKKQYSR